MTKIKLSEKMTSKRVIDGSGIGELLMYHSASISALDRLTGASNYRRVKSMVDNGEIQSLDATGLIGRRTKAVYFTKKYDRRSAEQCEFVSYGFYFLRELGVKLDRAIPIEGERYLKSRAFVSDTEYIDLAFTYATLSNVSTFKFEPEDNELPVIVLSERTLIVNKNVANCVSRDAIIIIVSKQCQEIHLHGIYYAKSNKIIKLFKIDTLENEYENKRQTIADKNILANLQEQYEQALLNKSKRNK